MAEAAAAGDGGAGTGTEAAALDELMLELDVDDEMMRGRDGDWRSNATCSNRL